MIIEESIQIWLRDTANRLLTDLNEFDIYDIDEVDAQSEDIKRYIKLDELSELSSWKTYITENQCDPAIDIINRDDFKPKALICRVSSPTSEFFLIKGISDSVFLRQKKVMKFLPSRGCYSLDENWDALLEDSKVLLINESRLLELFKYYEKFKEAAENTIARLVEHDMVSNLDVLREFVRNRVNFQKKLARATTYPLDDIKRDRILELINQGTINLRLNDEGKIECTTSDEIKVILDVLLDNYVSSLITDENYKALNKARLQVT